VSIGDALVLRLHSPARVTRRSRSSRLLHHAERFLAKQHRCDEATECNEKRSRELIGGRRPLPGAPRPLAHREAREQKRNREEPEAGKPDGRDPAERLDLFDEEPLLWLTDGDCRPSSMETDLGRRRHGGKL
jgi:hypothetical protein